MKKVEKGTNFIKRFPLQLLLIASSLLIPSWAYTRPPLKSLTFSGSLRLRGESRVDPDFDRTRGRDPLYGMERLRLNFSYQPSSSLSSLIQLQDSRSDGFGRPIDSSRSLHFHQAWIKIRPYTFPLSLQLGRQELSYGEERVIGVFGWSNVGRVYEGLRLSWEGKEGFVNLFITRVIQPFPVSFRPRLHGIYASLSKNSWMAPLEGYLLLKTDRAGGASRRRWTLGTRWKARKESWDYGLETAFQWGEEDKRSVSAWAYHLEAGYTLKSKAKPRLLLEYNFASGTNNPAEAFRHTFDNLFPTNHYKYGFMDFQSWKNMHNLQTGVSAVIHPRLTLSLDHHFFWLAEPHDFWYNAGGTPMLKAQDRGRDYGRFVGREVDMMFRYRLNPQVTLEGGLSRFVPSDFVRRVTGHDHPSDWGYLQTEFQF